MAADLLSLKKRMDKLAANILLSVNEHAKKVAIAILDDLVTVTPVDTSQALSNWQVSLDAPNYNSILPLFAGQKGSTAGASSRKAYSEGVMILKNKKNGQPIFITNNLPYIRDLNNGSSRQEPGGFVQRAVMVGRNQNSNFKLIKN